MNTDFWLRTRIVVAVYALLLAKLLPAQSTSVIRHEEGSLATGAKWAFDIPAKWNKTLGYTAERIERLRADKVI